MKTVATILVAILSVAAAFAPSPATQHSSTALQAEISRGAFFSAAALSIAGLAVPVANAMDQDLVSDPTEQWETGSPTKKAEDARMARYQNARTQMTSNFPPIKRLTLERKSPVTRLDINAPDFTAYKQTYPGLFK